MYAKQQTHHVMYLDRIFKRIYNYTQYDLKRNMLFKNKKTKQSKPTPFDSITTIKKKNSVCPWKNEENLLSTLGFNLRAENPFSCPFPYSLVAVQGHWSVERRGAVSPWTGESLLLLLLDLAALIKFIVIISV